MGHILRVEDDRDHGETVELEAESVAQANGGKTHIDREPGVDHADVDIVSFAMDKVISDKINDRGRNAEPYEDPGTAHPKEGQEPENEGQYDRIDDQCEFPDPV